MLPCLRYLLPILLLYARFAAAQAYEPGLLVRSNGDTLRGELENGFWQEPPKFIRYRPAVGSESQLFQPRQLQAVSFTNGRYFRFQALTLDHAAQTELNSLPRGNVHQLRTDSLLAEVLLAGPVSLLRVVLPGGIHYVLQRPGQPAIELCERKYLQPNARGTLVIMEGNDYRSQLLVYFGDCPAAVQVAEAAEFTTRGLAAVAQAYATTCTAAQQPARSWVVQVRPRRRGAFQAGLLAGVRYNKIESPASLLNGTCTDCLVRPFGGLYAELLQPSRTAAFYGELSVSTFHNQGVYEVNYSGITPSYTVFAYRAWLATARFGVRYLAPLPHDQQLVVGLGIEYNRVFGLTGPPSNAPSYYPSSEETGNAYAVTTLFPNLTAGWRYKRLTLALDYQMYGSNDDDKGLGRIFFDRNFAARFGIGYRLGRSPDTKPAKNALQQL